MYGGETARWLKARAAEHLGYVRNQVNKDIRNHFDLPGRTYQKSFSALRDMEQSMCRAKS